MDIRLRNMTTVFLHRGTEFLMLYRIGSRVIGNAWTGTAGGHFEPEEISDPRACVLRELQEETGLTESDIVGLALRYVTMRRKDGELRLNYYFFAEPAPHVQNVQSNEGQLTWVPADRLSSLPMPHSAKYMLQHYLSEGCHTDFLYGGVSSEHGVAFHLLQNF